MGNLGMPELMMILVLALLLFGPTKLPEIGKQVGKALGEFKRASNDLKRTIEDEMEKASSGLNVKLDDPPKLDAPKAEAARSETATSEAAPAIAPADGTVPRPPETTKSPAP
jgi:TatA/E family protein of Tat protein translocase